MGSLYKAKIEERVDVPRICDRCAHEYTVEYWVHVEGEDYSTSNKRLMASLQERAQAQLDGVVKDPAFGAYCPECRQFSAALMQLHFPSGVREGLQKLLDSRMRASERYARAYTPARLLRTFLTAFGLVTLPLFFLVWLPKDRLPESYRLVFEDLFGPKTSIFPAIIQNNGTATILLAGALVGSFCVGIKMIQSGVLNRRNRLLARGRKALAEIDDPERFIRERYIADGMRLQPNALEWAASLCTAMERWGDKRPIKYTGVCRRCGHGAEFRTRWEYVRQAMACDRCGMNDPYFFYTKAAAVAILALIIFFVIAGQVGKSRGPQ